MKPGTAAQVCPACQKQGTLPQAAARLEPALVHNAIVLSCSQLQDWTQSSLNTKGIADPAPDKLGHLNTSQIQQQLQACN